MQHIEGNSSQTNDCLETGGENMEKEVIKSQDVKPKGKKGKGEKKKRSGRSGASKKHTVPGRYKTELCRPFEERGVCRYGSKCQFAHGVGDLKVVDRHPRYKSELCKTFHAKGFCPYGLRCHFIHNELERTIGHLHQMVENVRAQEQALASNYLLVTNLLAMAASTPSPPPPTPTNQLLFDPLKISSQPTFGDFWSMKDEEEFRGRSMSLGSAGSSEYSSGGGGSFEDSSRFSPVDNPLTEYYPRLNSMDVGDVQSLAALIRETVGLCL